MKDEAWEKSQKQAANKEEISREGKRQRDDRRTQEEKNNKNINKQRHPRPFCDQLQRVFLLFVDNP